MSDVMVRPNSGAIVQQGFGEQSVTPYQETAARAVAAREQAAVQARYVMAMQYPRRLHDFRARILAECERPEFAAVARYVKPIGKDERKWPKGPSIRFVEAALRAFRNVAPEVMTVFDSDQVRVVRVTVTDLESNITYSNEIQISKTVERKGLDGKPPKDRDVISERTNSYGEKVYTVIATDDEVLIKQAALVSKAIRTQGLRLLPGDVVEECMARVVEVQNDKDAKDPTAALKRIMDSFGELGVMPSDLEAYLGKKIERITADDKANLRAVFSAIRDGETTWDEVMTERDPSGSVEAAQEVAARKLAAFRKTESEIKQATSKESAAPQAEAAEKTTEPTTRTTRMKL